MTLLKQPKQIRISEIVQPHFKKLWNTKCPYIIALGGRGSFKSSTISLKLVRKMKNFTSRGLKVNVVSFRENQAYLRDSVYAQIVWALNMLDLTDEYDFRTSPLRILHRRTGSGFYFYGVNDPQKLKSNTIGHVIALWFNFRSHKTPLIR